MISFSAVFVKLAHVGPTAAGFYRGLFGGVILTAIVIIRRESFNKGRRLFLMCAACGLLFALDLTCWHRSVHYVGPGLSTILANFEVFFLAAIGVLVFHEKLTWRLTVAIPLAVLGLFMLIGFKWQGLDPVYRAGVIFGLLTTLAYTAYILTLRRAQSIDQYETVMVNMAVISLTTALIMGVEAPLLGESLVIPDGQSLAALICYGIMGQVLGWVLISKGLPKVDASRVGLILLLQPTLAFIWDILFFRRSASALEIGGAILALGAIYLGSASQKAPARTSQTN